MDLRTYEQAVRELDQLDANEFISNGERAHAAILYQVFLGRAKQYMVWFCRNFGFEEGARPKLIEAFERAVAKGVRIQAILQERPTPGNKFAEKFSEIAKKYPGIVSLRIAADQHGESARMVEIAPSNFCVVDGKAFRWEPDWHLPKAIASMNRPDLARQLADVFESYSKRLRSD